jgi:hypothetical protein
VFLETLPEIGGRRVGWDHTVAGAVLEHWANDDWRAWELSCSRAYRLGKSRVESADLGAPGAAYVNLG